MGEFIGQLVLVLIAAISAGGGIYATVVSRRQVAANADKTDAEAEQLGDATWIARLDALSRDLQKLQSLSDQRFERMVAVEQLITDHVSWDFKVVRLLRQHDIAIEDPPSLVYVQRRIREEKATIERERNGDDSGPMPTLGR